MSNEPEAPNPAPANPSPPPASPQAAPGGKSEKKLVAGILAILLGALGIHKFYLGYTKEGIITLVGAIVISVVTCGIGTVLPWALGLAEGIIYLTKTDEEFDKTYVIGRKPWF